MQKGLPSPQHQARSDGVEPCQTLLCIPGKIPPTSDTHPQEVGKADCCPWRHTTSWGTLGFGTHLVAAERCRPGSIRRGD